MQLNLPELLQQHEGEKLDFKQRISRPEKIAKTLCAFANTRGGVLLVGIKDDRTITGIDPEEEKWVLEQAANDYCNPPVPLNYEEQEDAEGHTILIVTIFESEEKPHSCRSLQGSWQVYVRHRDKSIPAGKQLIRSMEKGTYHQVPLNHVYNQQEHGVMQFIETHERITIKQLMGLLNFSKRRAEKLLHDMSLKGMVRCFEHEKENFYA